MTERFFDSPSENELNEAEPIASFEEYRLLCDQNNGSFRVTGLQSEQLYNDAVNDPRSYLVAVGGRRLPLLSPVEYEDGYDAERTQQLTGKPSTLLLSLPARILDTIPAPSSFTERLIDHDTAILVESTDGQERQIVLDALARYGAFAAKEFHDPRIPDEASRTASMELFVFSIAPRQETEQPVADMWQAWQAVKQAKGLSEVPTHDSEESYLYNAETLRANPELMNKLWDISQHGFGKILGEFHPVSMEESREFFEKQLLGNEVYTAIRYHHGQPACFGALNVGIEECEWLDPAAKPLVEAQQGAAAHNETVLFFAEVISNGAKGANLSPDVMGLHFDVVTKTSKKYKVLFESTNLSALYIPAIATKSEAASGMYFTEPIHRIDKLDYWYAVPTSE